MQIEQLMFERCIFIKNKEELLNKIKEQEALFIVASPQTTMEDWLQKSICPYFSDNQATVFTCIDSANKVAQDIGAVFNNGMSMIISGSWEEMLQHIKSGADIKKIRFCGNPPFYAIFDYDEIFPLMVEVDSSPKEQQFIGLPQEPLDEVYQPPKADLVGIEALIKMYDCGDKSKICKYPTYNIFENFPMILMKLISVNKMDFAYIDQIADLDKGMTQRITKTPDIDLAKSVIKKILGVFGLEAYLYRFVKSSTEMQRELKSNTNVYPDKIVLAKVTTKERFVLEDVKRAKDENGAYLYRLALKSKTRRRNFVVVTPLSYVIGKEYEVCNLEPEYDESGENSMDTPVKAISMDEGAAVIARMKERYEKAQREYVDRRKDTILRYFKMHNSDNKCLNIKDAEALYNKLAIDDDLLDELFWEVKPSKMEELLNKDEEYLRRKDAQPGPVEVARYTAGSLKKEFKFKTWDVYFWLSDLRHKPKETKQQLKYLATEPQYLNK